MKKKLPLSFYQKDDVVQIAKDLLGKYLVTNINYEGITSGMIVETEAYAGAIDKASHAFGNKMTNRTKVMYEECGVSYVYMIYGFHFLFNVITNQGHIPHAVLIRAIEPAEGVDKMLERRKLSTIERKLTGGPGLLCKALGITKEQNGISLLEDIVWIEEQGIYIPEEQIIASPRVGVAYAEDDALLPYRFRVKDSKWTSPAK
jgi:DNA-3-methyladenine glycosylase